MNIPNEITFNIFSFLEKKDIKSLRLVCKNFYEICNIILFTHLRLKRVLKVDISQLMHLPIKHINNRYIKRFSTLKIFPETVNVVILSQKRPIITPETISQHPNIQFYISFGYIYPVTGVHESNYFLKNVKLFSTSESAMKFKILNKYDYFTFRYINYQHLECFKRDKLTIEEGIHILSKLKVERLVLIFPQLNCHVIPEQLIKFQNIVCISSLIFPRETILPLIIINEIQTLETIFIESGTLIPFSQFKELDPIIQVPSQTYWLPGCCDTQRICTQVVICLKQPTSSLGKIFTPSGPRNTWRLQLLDLYGCFD